MASTSSSGAPPGSNNSSPPINDYLELNSRVMVAALIILLVVVFFIVSLHIYAKWFWRQAGEGGVGGRRNRRRMGRSGRRGIGGGGGGEIYLMGIGESAGGLEKSEVDELPVFTYRGGGIGKMGGGGAAEGAAEEDEERLAMECAVCLSKFEDGEQGRLLPRCNHTFHTSCIDIWFHSHSTCPLCRSPVLPPQNPPPFSSIHPNPPPLPPPSSLDTPSPPTIAAILSSIPRSDASPSSPSSSDPSNHFLLWGDLLLHHSSRLHSNPIHPLPPPHLFHQFSASSSSTTPPSAADSSRSTGQHHLALDMDIHYAWPWQLWHGMQGESHRYLDDMGVPPQQQLWRSSSMSSTASSSSSSQWRQQQQQQQQHLKASQSFRMSIRRLLSRERSKGSRIRVFPAAPSTVDSGADDLHHSIPSPSQFNHSQNQNPHHQNNNNVAILVVADSQPAASAAI